MNLRQKCKSVASFVIATATLLGALATNAAPLQAAAADCFYVGKDGSGRCCLTQAPVESVCNDQKVHDCCATEFKESGTCLPKPGQWSAREKPLALHTFKHFTCAEYKQDPKFRMPMEFYPRTTGRRPSSAQPKRRTYYEVLDQSARFEFAGPQSASVGAP